MHACIPTLHASEQPAEHSMYDILGEEVIYSAHSIKRGHSSLGMQKVTGRFISRLSRSFEIVFSICYIHISAVYARSC